MTGRIFVKPAREGALVRQADRDMRLLPADGDWVADTTLWRRLINNGCVVEAKPPVEAEPPKAEPSVVVKKEIQKSP